MSTQWLKSNQEIRRGKRSIDLNEEPRVQEGTSATVRGDSLPVPAMIDVDAIDDDVIELSASSFAQAKRKSTRAPRQKPLIVDVESGGTTRLPANGSSKGRRVPSNQHVIDCELVSIYVDEVNYPLKMSKSKAPPPPPPVEPKFTCPICFLPLTEEMSTKCGHIFCNGCINKAISRNGKCPTCRKKATAEELIRVFLPDTR